MTRVLATGITLKPYLFHTYNTYYTSGENSRILTNFIMDM